MSCLSFDPFIAEFAMEARKDRKRKAAEVAESPEFVQAAITQLSLALTENEVKLRERSALCAKNSVA